MKRQVSQSGAWRVVRRGVWVATIGLGCGVLGCTDDSSPGGGADGDVGAIDVTSDVTELDAAPDVAADTGQDAGADTAADAADAGTGAAEVDPSTLTFFFLPIGSLRLGISGWVPSEKLCVTWVWFYNSVSYPICTASAKGSAYVVLTPSETPECGQWEYGPNAELLDFEGCFDAKEWAPHGHDYVDLRFDVDSEHYSGTIHMSNLDTFTPQPTFFSLTFTSDIPESVYAQTGDDSGNPSWIRLSKDGQAVAFLDDCAMQFCGENNGVCGLSFSTVQNFSGGESTGSIQLSWDGKLRVYDEEQDCYERIPAAPGDYVARFCWGYSVQETDTGPVVSNPQCADTPFTLPTDLVTHHIDNGG